MRVLVTGATGFIGRHTLSPLIALGYEVHAVSSKHVDEVLPADVRWYQCNLLDDKDRSSLMSKVRPTHLLHLAWYAVLVIFWRSKENFRWLEASISLVRYFREHGGQRVVMAGTCAEYDWDYGYCSEAVTPCSPQTPYGVCKNALQEVLKSYCSEEGLSCAWGRVFFLYGPGEHPDKLVASVISSLLRGEVAKCSHGNQIRDFLHVEDVASAFAELLHSDVEGTVNIASGNPVSIRDMVIAAADTLSACERVEFSSLPAPENEPPLLVGDVKRLCAEVGWTPNLDIHSGILNTVAWWKKQLTTG